MAPRKRTTTPEASKDSSTKTARKPKSDAAETEITPKTKASGKTTAAKAVKTTAKKSQPESAPKPDLKPAAKTPRTKAKKTEEAVKEAAPAITPKADVEAADPASSALPVLVGKVLAAILENRAVEFVFADADANPPRTFEPRQLIFDVFSKAWFAWGWDRRYNAERHHRVDLLTEVNAVEGVGRAAQGPYKEGTPSNQIGGWLGGEPIAVKALLLKQWIFAVKQAPAPFPEFVIQEAEDGKASVSFTGTDLRAIARWCMQFGDGIQVLEPQRLVDRIKQVGLNWAGKPKQESAPVRPPVPVPAPRPEPRPERSEARHEAKSEGRHDAKHEGRPERRHARPEPARDASRDAETKPSKPGRIEIRFDRL